MYEIERKIFVTALLLKEEYSYTFGANSNSIVYFHYYKPKVDKLSSPRPFTYKEALALARSRVGDGRYKNFEFFISESPL